MISQGTIFNNGLAAGYNDCEVYGLVISARCDIYNSKSNVYHYLPVVSLNDWFYNDFKHVMLDILMKDKTRELEDCIKQKGLNIHNVLSYGYREFADVFKHKFEGKTANKIEEICNNLDKICKCKTRKEYDEIIPICKGKQALSKFEELLSDNDNYKGFYYLNNEICEIGNSVVLLKDIKEISPKVIHLLDKYGSFTYKEFIMMNNKEEELKNININKESNTEIKTITSIESPVIESIIQKFSMIFSRVGIDRKIDLKYYYSNLYSIFVKE